MPTLKSSTDVPAGDVEHQTSRHDAGNGYAKMTAESEKTALSFGRYLQSIRVEKGISLKAVSQETRIRLETLHFIEEEDHQHLPDEVYVKGFLRAYAKAIGANGDEAVQRYISRLAVKRKIALSEAALYRTGGAFWRRLILSLDCRALLDCRDALRCVGMACAQRAEGGDGFNRDGRTVGDGTGD